MTIQLISVRSLHGQIRGHVRAISQQKVAGELTPLAQLSVRLTLPAVSGENRADTLQRVCDEAVRFLDPSYEVIVPWIRSKTRDENVKHIEGTEEEIESQFEDFLEGQRQQGHTVTESESFDVNGMSWTVTAISSTSTT